MKFPRQNSLLSFLHSCGGAVLGVMLLSFGIAVFAQSSVEKSQTSQQAKEPENELERAKAAVAKPDEPKIKPETGRQWGIYSTTSTIELGYRNVDPGGNVQRYLSDVNVRDGFRVLDYSFDMRARPGTGILFDLLKANMNNAGGDVAQNFYLRAEKTRAYRFDGNVRRFNYFRNIANFVAPIPNVTWRDTDLRQQVSDFNLKLFPQRAVRINAGYSRSMARGRNTPTYNFERDQFQLLGQTNWEANDFRLGLDATYRKWDFNIEQLYRNFHNDPFMTAKPGGDLGLNQTDNGRLATLSRVAPFHSRSLVTRIGVHGSVADRLNIVFRALHDDERMRAGYYEVDTGRANNGSNIIQRTLGLSPEGIAKRPGSNVDLGVSLEVTRHLTISNTFNYTAWRILGDMSWLNLSVQQTGAAAPVTTQSLTVARDYLTDLSSFRNTLEANLSYGRKFSANLGWRAMNRDVTLAGIWNATAANRVLRNEEESIFTNAFIGGMRYRPTNRTSLMFDVERGQNNNAFIRIAPLDYTRTRARAQIQATDKLWVNGTFTSMDRTNPTRQVENESTMRSYSTAIDWQPHSRANVDVGYDYHDLYATALIDYTLGTQRVNGRSFYYARLNSIFANTRFGLTNRLDLLMAYYYIMDRGNPAIALGANDQVNSYPLRRHNPEVRLAYRFSNNMTGNFSYRHYSYNERDFGVMDYRANILTTSFRFTF
ncbi:MAG: hypothetical protein ACKVX9_16240 [Blastocatellia bacterium]